MNETKWFEIVLTIFKREEKIGGVEKQREKFSKPQYDHHGSYIIANT